MTERANDGREINIRDAADDDLTAVAAILNREIAESPYVYADAPVTTDERREWLESHRASVYVDPSVQRKGIGARLLSRLCDEACRREMHALVASIDSENSPSIALFERHGFREAARLVEVGWKFSAWRTQLLFMRAVRPPENGRRPV